MVCQDRLGTNIGKALKTECRFLVSQHVRRGDQLVKVNGVDFRDEMVPVLNVKDERGRVVRVNGVEFGRGVMKRRCGRRAVALFSSACLNLRAERKRFVYQDRLGTNARLSMLEIEILLLSRAVRLRRSWRRFLTCEKRISFHHLILKTIILPRQARDEHIGKHSNKRLRFSRTGLSRGIYAHGPTDPADVSIGAKIFSHTFRALLDSK